MGRFLSAADPDDPAGTSDEAAALMDEEGNPVPNAARDTWITATALSTALNMSYLAEQMALFGIVVESRFSSAASASSFSRSAAHSAAASGSRRSPPRTPAGA